MDKGAESGTDSLRGTRGETVSVNAATTCFLSEEQCRTLGALRSGWGDPDETAMSVTPTREGYRPVPWSFIPKAVDLVWGTAVSVEWAEVGTQENGGTRADYAYGGRSIWGVVFFHSALEAWERGRRSWYHQLSADGTTLVPRESWVRSEYLSDSVSYPEKDWLVTGSAHAGEGTPLGVRIVRDQWCPGLAATYVDLDRLQVEMWLPRRGRAADYVGDALLQYVNYPPHFGGEPDIVAMWSGRLRRTTDTIVANRSVRERDLREALQCRGHSVPVLTHKKIHSAISGDDATRCPMCEVSEFVEFMVMNHSHEGESIYPQVMYQLREMHKAAGTKWTTHGLPEVLRDFRARHGVWSEATALAFLNGEL